jgi:cytochrome P450
LVSIPTTDWDPWNIEVYDDPYATYQQLLDDAPLYHNERHDFYVISRYADVERMLHDQATFIASKGTILDVLMNENASFPPGLFSFEDPPFHTFHRAQLSRVFTPRAISRIDDDVRDFCARTLDALAGHDHFDMMAGFAREVPMRVMGLLLGIPEADQPVLRDYFLKNLHRDMSKPADNAYLYEAFTAYIDWREEHPSDDLMTQLLLTEFEDQTGATRRLTREELLTYVNLIGAAGNDTTGLLIGWIAKLLGDHPDQRRAVVQDPSLIPNAVEEVIRFEPPPYAFGRYVAEDADFHGQTVPKGSKLVCIPGAANRDERHFGPDAARFDVHRKAERHLSFGYGPHFCLGANLARLEGRIALEELVRRMPDWQITDGARLVRGGPTRGYEHLPVAVGAAGPTTDEGTPSRG